MSVGETGWRQRPEAQVIAVERDVEDAEREPHALEGLDALAQAPCEVHAPCLHPDEREAVGGLGAVVEVLDDLPGQPVERAVRRRRRRGGAP